MGRGSDLQRWLLLGLGALLCAFIAPADKPSAAFQKGLASISEPEVRSLVNRLASPSLEGRDTPSSGLTSALRLAEQRLKSHGYVGFGEAGSMLLPWRYPRQLEAPAPGGCQLTCEGTQERSFDLGEDFSPLPQSGGEGTGPLVFLGFGIHAPEAHYDDFKVGSLKGKLAMILGEEPRHPKLLEGPEISRAANVFDKLAALKKAGAVGALVVRRPGLEHSVPVEGAADQPAPVVEFGFRHSWASWNDLRRDVDKVGVLPALEISVATANALLGEDVLELAARMDSSGKAERRDLDSNVVQLRSQTKRQWVNAHNLVGYLKGSDPVLSAEVVVLGAHFDHLGMDARGRLAAGADDNASGCAALLEVAEALALARPARSVLIVGFSGEEDGLLGSRAFCAAPPVDLDSMVAMINMDMIGRGEEDSTVALGTGRNRDLAKLVKRSLKWAESGIEKVVTNRGDELWRRSDHFSFHQVGVPALFFFEAVPISKNRDYHTWRDTPDRVNCAKVTHTAKFVFNLAWLLATDGKRPGESRR